MGRSWPFAGDLNREIPRRYGVDLFSDRGSNPRASTVRNARSGVSPTARFRFAWDPLTRARSELGEHRLELLNVLQTRGDQVLADEHARRSIELAECLAVILQTTGFASLSALSAAASPNTFAGRPALCYRWPRARSLVSVPPACWISARIRWTAGDGFGQWCADADVHCYPPLNLGITCE